MGGQQDRPGRRGRAHLALRQLFRALTGLSPRAGRGDARRFVDQMIHKEKKKKKGIGK